MTGEPSPGVTSGAGVLVVVPTYQERLNLELVLGRLLTAVPLTHVLVVDDGSPDGTGEIAERLAGADPRVHVLHRTAKAGLGAAYLAGFAWALEQDYDVIVEMDADGSHQPEQLPTLLAALSTADLVLGSRWVPGGSVVNWPLRRRLLSQGGNTYVRGALKLGIGDATGGFRAFRRATLDELDLAGVSSHGYCFQVDLVRRAVAAGFRVAEVPIEFVERTRGTSKMSGSIVREALWRVTVWGVTDRLDRARAVNRQTASAGGDRRV